MAGASTVLLGVLGVYAVIFGFSLLIGIGFLIMQGIGLSAMCKKLNIGSTWMCYLPLFNFIPMGRIAGKYENNIGKSNKKLGGWLVALSILLFVAVIAFVVLFAASLISLISSANSAILDGTDLAVNGIAMFIPAIIFYLITFGLAIAQTVIYYIVLWKIFSIFDDKNAVLFLVLSIFFNFLPSIFILVIRNKEPKCTLNQRLGIEEQIFDFEPQQTEI